MCWLEKNKGTEAPPDVFTSGDGVMLVVFFLKENKEAPPDVVASGAGVMSLIREGVAGSVSGPTFVVGPAPQ